MGDAIKLTKVTRGWYASADGKVAVEVDGLPRGVKQGWDDHNGVFHDDFGVGGEWSVVFDAEGRLREDTSRGHILDWFPTKREAVAAIPSFIARGEIKL